MAQNFPIFSCHNPIFVITRTFTERGSAATLSPSKYSQFLGEDEVQIWVFEVFGLIWVEDGAEEGRCHV